MIKLTSPASGFGKKTYAKPLMMAYQVNSATILAGSDSTSNKKTTENEEYEVESTTTWF